MNRLLPALLLILLTIPSRADDLRIHERYWQVLPGVTGVYVDHAGEPWFCTADGDPVGSRAKAVKQLHADQVLLLGDRKVRLWINHRYDGSVTTKYLDGDKWHDTGIHGRRAFEDSAGRIFLADGTHIHVLSGGQWTKQQMFLAARRPSQLHFAEDGKGRVWFWASDAEPATGLWSFARGEWINHRASNDLPFDDVGAVAPWSDDRFVLIAARTTPNFALWSPSRQLGEDDRKILGGHQPTRMHFRGTDLDGVHYFGADGLPADPEDRFGRSRLIALPPKGEARLMSKAELEQVQRWPQGLYENRARLFGRLNEETTPVPCSPTDAICRDRQGRTYFRWQHGVAVLWPKFERPGDVIRTAADSRGMQPIQTSDGAVWGLPAYAPSQLWRWDGKDWVATPVRMPRHPEWRARPAPPWQRWAHQTPTLLPGRAGTLLAIVTRDIYQDQASAGKTAGELRLLGRENDAAHWPEAWLYHKGEWSGPMKLPELLRSKHVVLTDTAVRSTGNSSWASLQSDGRRPWAAVEDKVVTVDSGALREWAIPPVPRNAVQSLNLCPLADGRMLLSHRTEDGVRLTALSLKEGKIVAEEFPMPDWSKWARYMDGPGLHAARDGSVWAWLPARNRGEAHVYRFHKGKWTERDDLGEFLLEEADGSMWFMPGGQYAASAAKERGYRIVTGETTATFPWPGEYEFGRLRPAPDGRLLAACGYWLVELGKADDPLKRPIAKARILDRYAGAGPAFVSKDGVFFMPMAWGK